MGGTKLNTQAKSVPLKKKVKEPLKPDSGKINSLVVNTWQAQDAAQALGVSADGAAYAISFICSCLV